MGGWLAEEDEVEGPCLEARKLGMQGLMVACIFRPRRSR